MLQKNRGDKLEKIKIEFKTITPVWTGDAWSNCIEIKPSSVMGSLRFWFEVYCYFAGIEVSYEKENLDYNWFKEELKRKIEEEIKQNKKVDTERIAFEIAKEKLTLPSLIFGCTGWKSRIEIESIRYLDDYCFGNRLNLPDKICIKKREDARGNCPLKSNNYWSVWYLPKPYFFGKFEITFKTTREIKDNVLLPLLNFIQKYGFLGAKNNIGYGRIRVLVQDISSYEAIKASEYGKKDILLNEIFEEVKNFNIKTLDNTKIQILLSNFKNNNLSSLIKGLLIKKARLRRIIEDNDKRHTIFGFTSKNKNDATKIIPLITQKDKEYEGNFLSIIGIENFGAKNEL